MTRAVGYAAALYAASVAAVVVALWREERARHRQARRQDKDPNVIDVELHCPDCGVVHLDPPGVTRDQVLRDGARYDREWRQRHDLDMLERQFRGVK